MNCLKAPFQEKNAGKILTAYVLMQPVLDLLVSLMLNLLSVSVSIGVFIRAFFMLYTVLYILVNRDIKYRKWALLYFGVLILYAAAFMINIVMGKPSFTWFDEAKNVVKAFYFPVMLVGMTLIVLQCGVKITDKLMTLLLFEYTAIIFAATVTGTYYYSYIYEKRGTVGWFYAPNEIGAIIAILLPFTLVYLFQEKKIYKGLIPFLITMFSVFYMGTKVPVLAYAGYLFVGIVVIIINLARRKKIFTKANVARGVCVLLATLFFLFTAPVCKNIVSVFTQAFHLEYMGTPGGENPDDLKDSSGNKLPSTGPDASILLSNRDTFLENVKIAYDKTSPVDKIVGMGHYMRFESGYSNKTIEMDFMDLYYHYGILGVVLYFAAFIGIFLAILIAGLKRFATFVSSFRYTAGFYAVLISCGVAMLAGHVFTAPAVSFCIVLAVIYVIQVIKEKNNSLQENPNVF